ncbi:hypothetical protein [Marinobacter sp. DY40_1A1]|uniref:hypothetical protein n=1 Tax=Marinobacter sp. DY40_1A1 TaxID=2583229 RepID=UPI0019073D13|nr:hypothetical protein [Marinobacter sp. DY40_1A1]MBK1887771.1 hypothetical protein [Marinobacter sp. DY40_1A1]
MEYRILKVLVSLGVPGVALGVFYLLFKSFGFSFPQVTAGWVGPIIVLFMLIVGAITFYALTLWRPSMSGDGTGVSISVPKNGATFKFVIEMLAANNHKSVEYEGFSDEVLEAHVRSQQITADTTEEAMEMVRGLSGGEVPPFQVTRSSFGGYVLKAKKNHTK